MAMGKTTTAAASSLVLLSLCIFSTAAGFRQTVFIDAICFVHPGGAQALAMHTIFTMQELKRRMSICFPGLRRLRTLRVLRCVRCVG